MPYHMIKRIQSIDTSHAKIRNLADFFPEIFSKGVREKKSQETKPRKHIELTTALLQKLKAGK